MSIRAHRESPEKNALSLSLVAAPPEAPPIVDVQIPLEGRGVLSVDQLTPLDHDPADAAPPGGATTTVRAPAPRAVVLGCQIDRVDFAQALAVCEEAIRTRRFVQHMAVNVAKLMAMRDDPELRGAVEQCELITADGQAVVWASRLLKDPLPERVAGIDLMHGLLASAATHGHRVYILGAKLDVLEAAVSRIREMHPQIQIVGYRDGYYDESDEAQVAAEIAAARPDMLFVAMSSPRKEYFLARHGRAIDAPFIMGVGGSIDVIAGVTRRAPVVMQKIGAEWLFRLLQEPRRLAKRYLSTNSRFVVVLSSAIVRRAVH